MKRLLFVLPLVLLCCSYASAQGLNHKAFDEAFNSALDVSDPLTFGYHTTTFSKLAASSNGRAWYCSDCQAASPCASGGTGAVATRVNGAWNCSTGGGVAPNAPITPATKTKITYDAKGLVTAGADIGASDLPSGIDAAKVANGNVSNTEYQYLDGVTSAIQTQIDGKQASLGFTPEDVANKDTDSTFAANSDTRYASQKAIKTAFDLKANLVSPIFTGVPAAPTAAVDTNTTQIATTAYVIGQGYAKPNSTTGVIPYLSASGVFSDSPLTRTSSTRITLTGDLFTSLGITLTGGDITNRTAGNFSWSSRSKIISQGDGDVTFQDNGNNTVAELNTTSFLFGNGAASAIFKFGGTTSSFPALKRSGGLLLARLADDSDYTQFRAKDLLLLDNSDNVTVAAGVTYTGLRVKSGDQFTFSSSATNALAASADTGLARSSAAVVKVTNGSSGYGGLEVLDGAYASGWDGSQLVPTRNAIYDKIETLASLSAANVFTATQKISNTTPQYTFSETDAGVDAKNWIILASGGSFYFQTLNDAENSGTTWMQVDRSGNTPTAVSLPNSTLNVSSSYKINGSMLYLVTTPTITSGFGVTPTIAGKASSFKVVVGTGGDTSGVVAFNGTFTNAPPCMANDETSNVLVRAVSTTTQVTISGVMAGGDVIKIICIGY